MVSGMACGRCRLASTAVTLVQQRAALGGSYLSRAKIEYKDLAGAKEKREGVQRHQDSRTMLLCCYCWAAASTAISTSISTSTSTATATATATSMLLLLLLLPAPAPPPPAAAANDGAAAGAVAADDMLRA